MRKCNSLVSSGNRPADNFILGGQRYLSVERACRVYNPISLTNQAHGDIKIIVDVIQCKVQKLSAHSRNLPAAAVQQPRRVSCSSMNSYFHNPLKLTFTITREMVWSQPQRQRGSAALPDCTRYWSVHIASENHNFCALAPDLFAPLPLRSGM
jgi:hypothetical protein